MSMVPIKPNIAKNAKVKSIEEYRTMYAASLKDPQGFWLNEARERNVQIDLCARRGESERSGSL